MSHEEEKEASARLLARLLPHVADMFSDFEGRVSATLQWNHAHEDLNAFITTRRGRFFLKAFPGRSASSAATYVSNHQALIDEVAHGLDVPRAIAPAGRDHPLITSPVQEKSICWYLMENIDGDAVIDVGITDQDRERVVHQMRILHQSSAKLHEQYDTRSALALPSTWPTRGHLMNDLERDRVRGVVTRVRELGVTGLSIGPVHGNIEPANLMRRRDLSISLIDFGTLSSAPVVIDLVMFLATCCLDDVRHPDHVLHRYQQWISSYVTESDIRAVDIKAVPDLLEATYWSYLLAARHAWDDGNRGPETGWWIRLATEGLTKLSEVEQDVKTVTKRLANEMDEPGTSRPPTVSG